MLRIVFICSSLEPGYDGVGDYTRRLASALIREGYTCAVFSLNDQYISQETEEDQQSDGIIVPAVRLPAAFDIKQRLKLAKVHVGAFNPQWISLQFVPFGYHSKGLKVGLGTLLSSLSSTVRWHIMFHELWVGIAEEESVKLKLWGRGQRVLIKSLVKKLKPAIIHTQTHLYQQLLSKMDIGAEYLPLFGNIPVVNQTKPDNDNTTISLVVFGAIHDRAPIALLAKEAADYAKKKDTPVMLTILGRGNSEQQRWADAFENEGLPVSVLGEQPAERISETLANASFGLSATALAVIEKSGSYAAMREHGLPVISVAKAWTPAGVEAPAIPDGVVRYQPGNFEACVSDKSFRPYHFNVFEVSAKFAGALLNVKTT